jgi:peptidoglycan/LPS O-acetylase OafA/YrhL
MSDMRRIPLETSVFLDISRVAAALAVFVSHFASHRFSSGELWFLVPLGSRAVDVFFVLSGFLISASVVGRPFDARRYAVARMARIFSVTAPALVFSTAVYILLLALDRLNGYFPGLTMARVLWEVLCNGLFVAEFWNVHIDLTTDGPYWSLCFEVIYYLAFGLAVCRLRCRWIVLALLVLAVGPRVMLLFPLWLLGAAGRHLALTGRLSPRAGMTVAGLSAGGLLAALPYFVLHFHGYQYEALDFSRQRWLSVFDSYLTGLLFMALAVGVNAARPRLSGLLLPLRGLAAWAAGRSFAFYLFHLPLMALLQGAVFRPGSSPFYATATFLLVPPLVALLAEISERRKDVWAAFFDRALPGRHVTPPPNPSP